MPVKAVPRPKVKPQLVTGTLISPDPQTQSRLLSDLADAHTQLATRVLDRNVVVSDLPVGTTRINHGLGKRAQGCTVTPTVADATWAWAMTAADDKQIAITTVGVLQPNATIEVF